MQRIVQTIKSIRRLLINQKDATFKCNESSKRLDRFDDSYLSKRIKQRVVQTIKSIRRLLLNQKDDVLEGNGSSKRLDRFDDSYLTKRMTLYKAKSRLND